MEKLNTIYKIDNLKLMEQMSGDPINLIYCDILYGTGKKFKDYQDLKPIKKDIENFYIPRIEEMHRLLKNTGSIYLHMDYRIVHWIRNIMDDIFGYNNFKNEIIWCYNGIYRKNDRFNPKHDNILYYTKTDNYIFNDNDIRIPYSAETIARYNRKGATYSGNAKESDLNRQGKIPEDYWNYCILRNQKEKVDYYSQKPKALIERIIKASSNEGDVVADFFCGSGTSLVVAKELNRQYIGCDISQKAVDITNERLNKIS